MNLTTALGCLMVMTCLVSCAAPGQTNNYKVLEDGPAEKNGGRYGRGEPKQLTEELAVVLSDEYRDDAGSVDVTAVQPASPAPDALPRVATALAPASASDTPAVESESPRVTASPVQVAAIEPSLNGLRRAHWPKITVGPTDGRTHHRPHYFRDLRIHHPHPAVGEANGIEALVGARPGNYDGTNAATLVLQPFKVPIDLVLLPGRAVLWHPLKRVTTP